MKRLRDDITEISESKPWHKDGRYVEHWHHFEPSGGNRTGHMIGMVKRTGDFDTDFEASYTMITDHNETCELRKRFEVEDE